MQRGNVLWAETAWSNYLKIGRREYTVHSTQYRHLSTAEVCPVSSPLTPHLHRPSPHHSLLIYHLTFIAINSNVGCGGGGGGGMGSLVISLNYFLTQLQIMMTPVYTDLTWMSPSPLVSNSWKTSLKSSIWSSENPWSLAGMLSDCARPSDCWWLGGEGYLCCSLSGQDWAWAGSGPVTTITITTTPLTLWDKPTFRHTFLLLLLPPLPPPPPFLH